MPCITSASCGAFLREVPRDQWRGHDVDAPRWATGPTLRRVEGRESIELAAAQPSSSAAALEARYLAVYIGPAGSRTQLLRATRTPWKY